jgi:hypothetical protein
VFGYLLLGLALLVLLLMVGRLLASVPPRQLLAAGKWVGLGALGGATVFLAVTGRLSWAVTAAAAFLPWIIRLVERKRTMGAGAGGRTAGGSSPPFPRTPTTGGRCPRSPSGVGLSRPPPPFAPRGKQR